MWDDINGGMWFDPLIEDAEVRRGAPASALAAAASRHTEEKAEMRKPRRAAVPAMAALLVLALAACGSGTSSSSGGSDGTGGAGPNFSLPLKTGENPLTQPLTAGRRGGTLTAYTRTDFKNLDPGSAYSTLDYAIAYATQRPLFVYAPHTQTALVPDLATAVPTRANHGITDGGRTVTVHIERGVHFSPPVSRTVTSADVAYAIERGANPNVGNAYFAEYFGSASPSPLVGAQSSQYTGGPIPGIRTPNKTTIVFQMTEPGAATLISALSLPLSAPVPRSFAGSMDRHAPTRYGSTSEVATGPYVIESRPNGDFAGYGYQPGRSLTLVRNPNWAPGSYTVAYRPPAYLNRIDVSIGGQSPVIGRQVLQGSGAVELDAPTPSITRDAYELYPSQMTVTPGTGDVYAALDNQHGVFRNVNLRRALWAALDRAELAKVVGGSLVAEPMTHFIYPGNLGFTQSGGYPGPQVPWNMDINGSLSVAERYMKAAGYKSGKYTGSQSVSVVGATDPPFPKVTAIMQQTLTELGFHVRVNEVSQSEMYGRYCGTPRFEIDVCPAVGRIRDFADPLSTLYQLFYGPAIVSTNNINWGQVNIPAINSAMATAALIVAPITRGQAWANIDKQLVENAVAAPEYFANQPNIESANVQGVTDLWNQGTWDLAYTSLKHP